jgi:hypothetical protein
MKTITDYTNGRLNEIIEFADNNKLTLELYTTLSRFYRHLANGYNVELYPDFAPMSMTFAIKNDDGTVSLNGGFIFHGNHDNGGDGGAPTFSVSLDNDSKPRWSIHT